MSYLKRFGQVVLFMGALIGGLVLLGWGAHALILWSPPAFGVVVFIGICAFTAAMPDDMGPR